MVNTKELEAHLPSHNGPTSSENRAYCQEPFCGQVGMQLELPYLELNRRDNKESKRGEKGRDCTNNNYMQ